MHTGAPTDGKCGRHKTGNAVLGVLKEMTASLQFYTQRKCPSITGGTQRRFQRNNWQNPSPVDPHQMHPQFSGIRLFCSTLSPQHPRPRGHSYQHSPTTLEQCDLTCRSQTLP